MKRDERRDRSLVELCATYGIEEAARMMGRHPQTLKNRLGHIYAEWHARNLAHAALMVSRRTRDD